MHGVGVVEDIVLRSCEGRECRYYVFRAPAEQVVVLIPVASERVIGVRPLAGRDEALEALRAFETIEPECAGSWTRRYRDNMLRLKSGRLIDTVTVVKSLMLRAKSRELSTGEHRMLALAKGVMLSELQEATGIPAPELEDRLSRLL